MKIIIMAILIGIVNSFIHEIRKFRHERRIRGRDDGESPYHKT